MLDQSLYSEEKLGLFNPVLSQAVNEDTVRLSMGTVIQQGLRIAERQFL